MKILKKDDVETCQRRHRDGGGHCLGDGNVDDVSVGADVDDGRMEGDLRFLLPTPRICLRLRRNSVL